VKEVVLAGGGKAEVYRDGSVRIIPPAGSNACLTQGEVRQLAGSPAAERIEIKWRDVTVSIKGGG
jgi:hypothetical protein